MLAALASAPFAWMFGKAAAPQTDYSKLLQFQIDADKLCRPCTLVQSDTPIEAGQPVPWASPVERLRQQFQSDPDYAWSWHCNIAVAAMDECLWPSAANRAAARFMKTAFGVDATQDERFAATQKPLDYAPIRIEQSRLTFKPVALDATGAIVEVGTIQ